MSVDKWIDEIHIRYKKIVGNIDFPIDERILITVIEQLKKVKIKLVDQDKHVYRHVNEGILIPVKGGFILRYGVNPHTNEGRIFSPVGRVRFTICHELAHVLFYDCTGVTPKLVTRPPEHLCNEIARKMLLPAESVKRKFYEEFEDDGDIIPFLKKFVYDTRVSIYPVVKRLIEDLSLIRNRMITFWRYKGNKSKSEVNFKNYRIDSKLSDELRKNLSYYWRRKIYIKTWNEIVKYVAKDKKTQKKIDLTIRGREKTIIFDAECEPWKRTLLSWTNIPEHLISSQKIKQIGGIKFGFK